LRALLATWNSPEDFLHDVAHNSGLIGAHDGPREPWRYLHRSLREFLVAEALNNDSAVAITALLPRLRDDRVGRWGEPIALLCGLVSDPLSLLNEVKACNADLALRAILNAEGITPSAAAQFIRSTGQSLEHLERIARMWVASREEEDIERTRELLFLMVRPELAARELAVIHLVMERVGVTPRRETFFSCAGRLPPQDQTIPAMVRVSGGSFLMGQCHPDLRSSLDKKPRVETVTGFEIAIVPTTAEQYLPFAATFADSESSYADPKLPVTSVTWWHAYLFARWLGCTLPTEVQWEYACRAGSGTTFCSGDTVEDLDRVAWYKENSGGRLHAVAEKQPNQLGLYDMHGNVWEWCLNPTTSSDDEIHEEYWCTLRGGSWANEAQRARSADSSSWPAGKAYPLIGFRLVRPAK
jgi:formylglycine-generating enzyme required for sulfatase activity